MRVIVRALAYAWAAPCTAIGLALCLLYWPRRWRWEDGALVCTARRNLLPGAWVAAQTWGWLIVYRTDAARARVDTRVHELRHVRQTLILGPLFLVAYPLLSLLAGVLPDRHHYRDNLLEIDAQRAAAAARRLERRWQGTPATWGEDLRRDLVEFVRLVDATPAEELRLEGTRLERADGEAGVDLELVAEHLRRLVGGAP